MNWWLTIILPIWGVAVIMWVLMVHFLSLECAKFNFGGTEDGTDKESKAEGRKSGRWDVGVRSPT